MVRVVGEGGCVGDGGGWELQHFLRPPERMRWSMSVLTSFSHRAGQGVSQDHFGSLIHHMVLEITLGYHFRLRSHFSENSVCSSGMDGSETITRRYPGRGSVYYSGGFR